MSESKFYWVIRSKDKREGISGRRQYFYLASRTAPKNKRYMTEFHFKVRWFVSRAEASEYLLIKARQCGPTKCVVSRKKMFLDKDDKYDYWKNREALLK